MKDKRCKIGFHDLEVVDTLMVHDYKVALHKKVCVREGCNYIKDEITPWVEKKEKIKKREKTAKEKYKELKK